MIPRAGKVMKFFNVYSYYHRDASKISNSWHCNFQAEDQNVKLLTNDEHQTTENARSSLPE